MIINMKPKVSIIMPVYNVAPYLKEAIDSILSQTFTDYELIVLNDCSPDNSEEILNTYTDKRIIRYLGDKNVGLASILNIGIKMAKGEYIARMDSDDISLPKRIEVQVAFLESHPNVDLVSSAMQRFGDSDLVMCHTTNYEDIKFNAISYSPVLHASSMWRKDRFINEGLFYRQEMVPSEDYDLWTRALIKHMVLANISDILYKYRSHDSQVTNVNKDWSKSDLIGYEYVKAIFPWISDQKAREFRNIMTINIASNFKKACLELEQENKKACYFDPAYLRAKLKRYYQAKLLSEMQREGIKWDLIPDLRLKQIIKILVYKARGKYRNSTI